jgi:peroxiredoxin
VPGTTRTTQEDEMNSLKRIGALTTIAIAAAGLYAAPASTRDAAAPVAVVDKPAPDFTLPGTDGKKYTLTDFKGKYVVLEWNNPDCPFVKKHYNTGHMQALQKEYTGKDVVWLTVCSSAPGKQGYYPAAEVEKMCAEKKVSATSYLQDPDGTVGRMYGAKTTPNMFVINPDGILIYSGAIDDKPSTKTADLDGAANYVRSCLDAAMAGKPVGTKSTTPYGCSVKYAD